MNTKVAHTANVALSTQHFTQLMNDMRHHHKSGVAGPFNLSSTANKTRLNFLALAATGSASPDISKQIAGIHDEVKGKIQASTADQKNKITSTTNDLQSNKNVDDFKSKMLAQRDAAKKANDDAIDAAYDKAIKLGTDHPESQGTIVQAMSTISNTVQTVLTTVFNLIDTLISKIQEILDLIFKPIEFIENTFSSISHMF